MPCVLSPAVTSSHRRVSLAEKPRGQPQRELDCQSASVPVAATREALQLPAGEGMLFGCDLEIRLAISCRSTAFLHGYVFQLEVFSKVNKPAHLGGLISRD